MSSSNGSLTKDLTLYDVYAISTGAMFSSGFFLLPGLAAAETGPSVILAYLVAGILILPSMYSMAELSTAMPKAGGTYYVLDRSLGPLAGTVGGLGTWLALVFKSAFALIGMGAYLALYADVPIKPLAAALTVAFGVLNVVGVKESSWLQRVLVTVLLGVLAFYAVQGLTAVWGGLSVAGADASFTPFFSAGAGGFLATIGLVFVSYAGLTKVASVAEEVQNPDRNIPLGMLLSLATATAIYVMGVTLMVAVLPAEALNADLTPVYTAGEVFFNWLPYGLGPILIVVAAIAAFASTGNAGIMSASRYPLAMARDRLLPESLARVGRFETPTRAVVVTVGLMLVVIVVLSEEGVAKLASAFQLLIFALLNVAVIVMRESRIPSYAPGYRSPFYPWMQIAGLIIPGVLVFEMGILAMVFTGMVMLVGVAWYTYYVKDVRREGAIFHLFERLGRRRHEALAQELQGILEEKRVSDDTAFGALVARAETVRLDEPASYEGIVEEVAQRLATRRDLSVETLKHGFLEGTLHSAMSVRHGAALSYCQLDGITEQAMVLVHCSSGVCIDEEKSGDAPDTTEPVYAFFFLVSPNSAESDHLRTLATLARRIDEDRFMAEWRAATDARAMKESLLHHERYITLDLLSDTKTGNFIGRAVKDLDLPAGAVVALVRREEQFTIPDRNVTLKEGDQVTIIGDPAGIGRLYELYRSGSDEGGVQ